ncbi:MAG: GNAT family N-acetyltransferase [Alphaproteobacteria bacterium]
MSEIFIRRAEQKDFLNIQKVQLTGGETLLTNEDAIEIADMELQVKSSNGIIGVAESDGGIIGFIYGEKLAARWALSSYFVVLPEFRGTSAAHDLGEWFISECKSRGAKYIVCYVDKDNQKLINFYQYFGFESGGTYVEMIKEI